MPRVLDGSDELEQNSLQTGVECATLSNTRTCIESISFLPVLSLCYQCPIMGRVPAPLARSSYFPASPSNLGKILQRDVQCVVCLVHFTSRYLRTSISRDSNSAICFSVSGNFSPRRNFLGSTRKRIFRFIALTLTPPDGLVKRTCLQMQTEIVIVPYHRCQ